MTDLADTPDPGVQSEEALQDSLGRFLASQQQLLDRAYRFIRSRGVSDNQTVFGVIVAASPPLALLLAVELLNRALRHRREAHREIEEPAVEAPPRLRLADVSDGPAPTAEQHMWEHYLTERAHVRTSTWGCPTSRRPSTPWCAPVGWSCGRPSADPTKPASWCGIRGATRSSCTARPERQKTTTGLTTAPDSESANAVLMSSSL